MAGNEELLQVERVVERLAIRYPSVPRADIERVVRNIHNRFATSRIRDFVPLLVEKAAKRTLMEGSVPLPEPTPALPDTG